MSATATVTTVQHTTLTAEASTAPSAQSQKRQDEQDVDVYDEIEIEDMTYDSALQIYHYPCPCGDRFEINIDSLRDGEEIAVCPSCSLMIRVIFDKDDLPEKTTEVRGDLIKMASPSPSVILAHACNCKGQAGAGVAKALKASFPAAIQEYSDFCKGKNAEEIVGSAVVTTIELPVATGGGGNGGGGGGGDGGRREEGVCRLANLLTSKDYGRRKDKAETILRQTEAALKDLRSWIEQQGFEGKVQVFSNKMNAGFFAVEWAATLGAINKVFGDTDVEWTVVVVVADDGQHVAGLKESKSERGRSHCGKRKVRARHPYAKAEG